MATTAQRQQSTRLNLHILAMRAVIMGKPVWQFTWLTCISMANHIYHHHLSSSAILHHYSADILHNPLIWRKQLLQCVFTQ